LIHFYKRSISDKMSIYAVKTGGSSDLELCPPTHIMESNIPPLPLNCNRRDTPSDSSIWQQKSRALRDEIHKVNMKMLQMSTATEEGFNAVHQFIARFLYLRGSPDDLESALSSFGSEFEEFTMTVPCSNSDVAKVVAQDVPQVDKPPKQIQPKSGLLRVVDISSLKEKRTQGSSASVSRVTGSISNPSPFSSFSVSSAADLISRSSYGFICNPVSRSSFSNADSVSKRSSTISCTADSLYRSSFSNSVSNPSLVYIPRSSSVSNFIPISSSGSGSSTGGSSNYSSRSYPRAGSVPSRSNSISSSSSGYSSVSNFSSRSSSRSSSGSSYSSSLPRSSSGSSLRFKPITPKSTENNNDLQTTVTMVELDADDSLLVDPARATQTTFQLELETPCTVVDLDNDPDQDSDRVPTWMGEDYEDEMDKFFTLPDFSQEKDVEVECSEIDVTDNPSDATYYRGVDSGATVTVVLRPDLQNNTVQYSTVE